MSQMKQNICIFVLVILIILVLSETTISCGGRITALNGTVTSQGYPNDYPNNSNCTWVITSDSSYVLTLHVEFSLEKTDGVCSDYLLIGDDVTGLPILSLCGEGYAITSIPGHSVKIQFVTDDKNNRKGFFLSFTKEPLDDTGTTVDINTTTSLSTDPTKYNTTTDETAEYPHTTADSKASIPMSIFDISTSDLFLDSSSSNPTSQVNTIITEETSDEAINTISTEVFSSTDEGSVTTSDFYPSSSAQTQEVAYSEDDVIYSTIEAFTTRIFTSEPENTFETSTLFTFDSEITSLQPEDVLTTSDDVTTSSLPDFFSATSESDTTSLHDFFSTTSEGDITSLPDFFSATSDSDITSLPDFFSATSESDITSLPDFFSTISESDITSLPDFFSTTSESDITSLPDFFSTTSDSDITSLPEFFSTTSDSDITSLPEFFSTTSDSDITSLPEFFSTTSDDQSPMTSTAEVVSAYSAVKDSSKDITTVETTIEDSATIYETVDISLGSTDIFNDLSASTSNEDLFETALDRQNLFSTTERQQGNVSAENNEGDVTESNVDYHSAIRSTDGDIWLSSVEVVGDYSLASDRSAHPYSTNDGENYSATTFENVFASTTEDNLSTDDTNLASNNHRYTSTSTLEDSIEITTTELGHAISIAENIATSTEVVDTTTDPFEYITSDDISPYSSFPTNDEEAELTTMKHSAALPNTTTFAEETSEITDGETLMTHTVFEGEVNLTTNYVNSPFMTPSDSSAKTNVGISDRPTDLEATTLESTGYTEETNRDELLSTTASRLSRLISESTKEPDCGGHYKDRRGELTSPGYGSGSYPNNSNCTWYLTLNTIGFQQIAFSITDLDVENSDKCFKDSLAFYDGSTKWERLIVTHCGEGSKFVIGHSNRAKVVFLTDGESSGAGWRLIWGSYSELWNRQDATSTRHL